MENITPATLWAIVLAAASAIVLISNAVEKIIMAAKIAKAPGDRQNARLDALEKWQKDVDGKLSKDNERLEEIEDGNRAIQHALLALLDHSLDGNNIKQMQDAKAALRNHLINK